MALVFVGIELPNVGHFVIDHSSVAPKTVFASSFREQLIVWLLPVIPLICIFAGMWRRSIVEEIGWGLLIVLFILGLA